MDVLSSALPAGDDDVVIGREDEPLTVGVAQPGRPGPAQVDFGDSFLPAADQVAARLLVSQAIRGGGSLPAQAATHAAHDLGRRRGRKRPRMGAPEHDGAVALDDSSEDAIALDERLAAEDLLHDPLLVREQVVQGQTLVRSCIG